MKLVMPERAPRVFSIPPGAPFLKTLAEAIVECRLFPEGELSGNSFPLSEFTIFLPTRRAARVLLDLIVTISGDRTILLPKILPIGGLDDAEDQLIIERGIEGFLGAAHLLPEIDPIKRRLVLTKLVLAWAQRIESTLHSDPTNHMLSPSLAEGILRDPGGFAVAKSVRDGLQLADALGQLIDTLVIHGKTWENVHALLPLDLADEYWRISKDFLAIAAEAWPEFCSMNGVMDAAERRHRMILAEAERLSRDLPTTPMIAAGSTGSMPATSKLISAIARLPLGAVVLPGLDQSLDEFSWQTLIDKNGKLRHSSHPQAQLARLLSEIGITRRDVIQLGISEPRMDARGIFLSEAMRPPEVTELWQSRAERLNDETLADALQNVSVIEAEQEREEALAIAIALRRTLETPDKIAALITPDRSLAERVSNELKRWGILVEDSAGIPLERSCAGSLALLVAEAVDAQFSSFALLALLNHPSTVLGLDRDTLEKGKNAIDLGLLRSPLTQNGLAGVCNSLNLAINGKPDPRAPRPLRRLENSDWLAADAVLSRLNAIFLSVEDLRQDDVIAIMRVHERIIRQVTEQPNNPDAFDELEGAEAMVALFDATLPHHDFNLGGGLSAYPGFLKQLMNNITVARFERAHPRIKIWGLLEARLMPADLVVLAGLDEAVWPPEMRADAFLNRPWREELDLPAPERRIGQTAHDFIDAMGAKEVIITRSIKRGGSPTVASRFLQRISAVAGEAQFACLLARGAKLIDYARTLDKADTVLHLRQPRPVPNSALLPKKLSVTEIETLRRDPYSIYAKHILKLDRLDPIGKTIGPSELGTMFHEAFSRFVENWPTFPPANPLQELLAIGREAFRSVAEQTEFNAFWWPRFEEAARWFVGWDLKRRNFISGPLAVERRGALVITLPNGGEIILSGQADRIEIQTDNGFSIIDFKTGKTPTVAQVKAGFSPQLTIEAAMLKRNAFHGLAGKQTNELLYVKLGSKNGGEERPVRDIRDPFDPDDLAELHFSEMVKLIDEHWNGKRPFLSRPYPEFLKDYGRYDHLARVREWSLTGGSAEDGGEE